MTVRIYYYTDVMQLLVEKETQLAEKKDLESELVSEKPIILIYLHLLPHFVVVVFGPALEYAAGSDEFTGTEHVRGSVCG